MNKLTFQVAKLEIVMVTGIIKVIVVAAVRKTSQCKGNRDASESEFKRAFGSKVTRELLVCERMGM